MEPWEANGLKIRDSYLNPEQGEPITGVGPWSHSEQQAVCAYNQRMIEALEGLWLQGRKKIMCHPVALKARTLFDADRAGLAADLETVLYPQPERRGRPQDDKLRDAACLALAVYWQWKADNIIAGINDRGLGHQMKDRSRDYAVEILYRDPSDGTPPDREAVREMMDRPIRRRK